MATVAIVGASGYVGQETLDRVLAHPGLELYALGSDSLAGQPADALDPRLGRNGWGRIPRFITNEAALSCGADVVFLCLSHEEAAATEPPSGGVVVDLSGACWWLPTRYGVTFSSTTPACEVGVGERPAPVIPDFASTTTPSCSISPEMGARARSAAVA